MYRVLVLNDLYYELKSKEVLLSMLTFGLAVLIIFSFSLSGDVQKNHELAPGLFWSMVVLSSTLGLNRQLGHEKEMDAFSSLLSAPVDRGILFLSKWTSSSLFLLIFQLLVIIPFFFFLGFRFPENITVGFGLMLLGNLGINSVGVTIAGIAMRAKMSSILLPIIMFPLLTPLLIACVKSTAGWFTVSLFSSWKLWVLIMFSYLVVFTIAGYIFFEHISEE